MNSRSFWWGFKVSSVKRIALSGILIAIGVIFNKVVQIGYPYIPVPFVRIAFGGPALIMLAGLLLGPIYGAFIGAMVDVLGYFIFDIKTFGFFPLITLTYLLLGFFAGILFGFIIKLKDKKKMQIIMYSILALVLVAISLVIVFSDNIAFIVNSGYKFDLWMKIAFPIMMFALYVMMIIFMQIADKKIKNDENRVFNIYQIGFASFLLDFFIMCLFGSLMKGLSFSMDLFLVILITQFMTMFFTIPFNTLLLTTLDPIIRKFGK